MLATVSTPSRLSFSVLKGLGWASPAGMFAWLALGWSLAVLLAPSVCHALARVVMRPASSLAVGLGITAVAALLVTLEEESDRFQWAFDPSNAMTSQLDGRLPQSGPLLARADFSSPFIAFRFHTAVVYQLRRRGYHVVVPTPGFFALADKLGTYYSAARHPPQTRCISTKATSPSPVPAIACSLGSRWETRQ